MTQALLNNLTNQQFIPEQTTGVKDFAMDTDIGDSFQDILDKQIPDKTEPISGTIGALKDNIEDKFAKLTSIIQEVMQEVADESSLDLTLEKEIEDVVDNLELTYASEDETDVETDSDLINTEDINNAEDAITMDIQHLNDTPVIQALVQQSLQQSEPVKDDITLNDEEESELALNNVDSEVPSENLLLQNNIPETTEITTTKEGVNKTETEEKTLEDIVEEDMLKELNIESVETETSNENASSDLMKNQTAEEAGVKAMLHASADFNEVMAEAEPVVSSQNSKPAADVTSGKIIEQIAKQMEGMYNGSKVNIVLNPESLGKVSLQIINTKEGLSAQFTVATQEARNLIMKGLDGLKDTLMSHGVSVDNVSVKLSESQEAEYNADWTEQEGSRGGNKEQGRSGRGQEEERKFEQMMAQQEDENGKV